MVPKLAVSTLLALPSLLLAAPVEAHELEGPAECVSATPEPVPAFPGAEGYGAGTEGGRCGIVVTVTHPGDLDPLVPVDPPPIDGTLRWALEDSEHDGLPRTIVFNFDPANFTESFHPMIKLDEPLLIGPEDAHITIAGETAPGGGVVISNFGLVVQDTHDVILRHLRFRNVQHHREGLPPDCDGEHPVTEISAVGDGVELKQVERVIVDHVSVSWATDEGIGVELPESSSADITIQNSFVAETLWRGDHPCVEFHSRGIVASDGTVNVSLHHSLVLSNNRRNPAIRGLEGGLGEEMDVRWNLGYNWGNRGGQEPAVFGHGLSFARGVHGNVVGNWLREGEDTEAVDAPHGPAFAAQDPEDFGTAIFLDCNCLIDRDPLDGSEALGCPSLSPGCPGVDDPSQTQEDLVEGPGAGLVTFSGTQLGDPPDVAPSPDSTMDFLTYILNKAGALPHDHWDRKFLRDYRTGVGDLGTTTEDDLDGLTHGEAQALAELHPPLAGPQWVDADCDGIDDAWEAADVTGCYAPGTGCCTNWDTCSNNDAVEDCPTDGIPGYTDLEVYLHDRAQFLEDAVLFADEFEDWEAPLAGSWDLLPGEWAESEGYLLGSPAVGETTTLAEASPLFVACDEECSVAATLRATNTDDTDANTNVRLLAWKVPDVDTFLAVSLRPHAGAAGQVVIERRQAMALQFQCTIETPIALDTDYDVRIEYVRQSTTGAYEVYFNVSTDEETFLAACGQGVDPPTGTVGVGSYKADVSVGRVAAVRAN